jgi:hypothetical protein
VGEESETTPQKAAPTAPRSKKEEPPSKKGLRNGKKDTEQGDERKEEAKDPQLDRAVELLKGWEIFKSRFIEKPKAS